VDVEPADQFVANATDALLAHLPALSGVRPGLAIHALHVSLRSSLLQPVDVTMLCHGPGPQHEATGTDHYGNGWCAKCWQDKCDRADAFVRGEGLQLSACAERTVKRLRESADAQRWKRKGA